MDKSKDNRKTQEPNATEVPVPAIGNADASSNEQAVANPNHRRFSKPDTDDNGKPQHAGKPKVGVRPGSNYGEQNQGAAGGKRLSIEGHKHKPKNMTETTTPESSIDQFFAPRDKHKRKSNDEEKPPEINLGAGQKRLSVEEHKRKNSTDAKVKNLLPEEGKRRNSAKATPEDSIDQFFGKHDKPKEEMEDEAQIIPEILPKKVKPRVPQPVAVKSPVRPQEIKPSVPPPEIKPPPHNKEKRLSVDNKINTAKIVPNEQPPIPPIKVEQEPKIESEPTSQPEPKESAEKLEETVIRVKIETTDAFGYRSPVLRRVPGIFSKNSETVETIIKGHDDTLASAEDGYEKDMTWLRELSSSEHGAGIMDNNNTENIPGADPRLEARNQFSIAWWICLLGGRMPFTFARRDASRTLECRCDRKRLRFFVFILTSLFHLLIAVVSLATFTYIFFHDDLDSPDYERAEKFLHNKQWPVGLLFILTFVSTAAFSFSVILNGGKKAAYFTQWSSTLDYLSRYGTIIGLKSIWIIWLMAWFLLSAALLVLYFICLPSNNALIEAVDLVSAMLFRFLVHEMLLSPHKKWFGLVSLVIFIYGQFCSTIALVLAILFAKGTKNLLSEWNLRLVLLLKQVLPQKNEPVLTKLSEELKYKAMFLDHNKLMELVQMFSSTFSVVLFCYFLSKVIVITTGMYDVALYLLRNDTTGFNHTWVTNLGYTYDKRDLFSQCQSVCVVIIPAIGFYMSSLYWSQLSEVITQGFDRVTRYNLIAARGTHERRFLLSILMKASGACPYGIDVYGFFSVRRGFMFSFFAVSVTVLSVMVQCNVPRLINVPILFECEETTHGLCHRLRYIGKNPDALAHLSNMSILAFNDVEAKKKANHGKYPTKKSGASGKRKKEKFPCLGLDTLDFKLPESEIYKCPGTEVVRFYTYTKKGDKITPQEKTLPCLYDPYPDSETHHDCFGNELKEYDDCNQLNFAILSNKKTTYPTITLVTGPYTEVDDVELKSFNCFEYNKGYEEKLFKGGSDTYLCGHPAQFLPVLCKKGTAGTASTKKKIPQAKDKDEFRKHIDLMERFKKDKSLEHTCRQQNTYVTYKGDKFEILSPIEARASDGSGKRLLQTETNEDIFVKRRFAYAHPDLVKNTLALLDCRGDNTPKYTLVPYEPDQCGGLTYSEKNVPKKIEAVQIAGKTYNCYPSMFTGYKCGVKEKFAKEVCEGWEKWLADNPPKF